MRFAEYIKEIWRGKDLYRMLMNNECANHTLSGKVIDLGSGLHVASYHRFFQKRKDMEIAALDVGFKNQPSEKSFSIDFEKDTLPYQDNSIDVVLAFNIFEHVYNHAALLKEIHRILKPGGRIIGAVPFLVGYHPDPHDYWRYTSESLEKLFLEQNFKNTTLKILGRGPFTAGYSQFEFILSRFLKIVVLQAVLFFDIIILKLKPKFNRQKFALGLFFTFSK